MDKKEIQTPFDSNVKKIIYKKNSNENLKTSEIIKHTVLKLFLYVIAIITSLSWNESFKLFFSNLFNGKNAMKGMFLYAIVATCLAISIAVYMNHQSP